MFTRNGYLFLRIERLEAIDKKDIDKEKEKRR